MENKIKGSFQKTTFDFNFLFQPFLPVSQNAVLRRKVPITPQKPTLDTLNTMGALYFAVLTFLSFIYFL